MSVLIITERVGSQLPNVSVFKFYRTCRFYIYTERVGFQNLPSVSVLQYYRACRFRTIPIVSVLHYTERVGLYRFHNNTERVGFTYFAERVGFTFQNTERVGFTLQNTERVGFTF